MLFSQRADAALMTCPYTASTGTYRTRPPPEACCMRESKQAVGSVSLPTACCVYGRAARRRGVLPILMIVPSETPPGPNALMRTMSPIDAEIVIDRASPGSRFARYQVLK